MEFNELFVDTKLPHPLEKEELYDCFEKMKLGNMETRDDIIIHNIRFVIAETLKYKNCYAELKELVSIGLVGLVKSVDAFDINKGVQFATFSSRCINNEILMYLKKGKKYINNISLNQPLCIDKDGRELIIEDIIDDPSPDFTLEYEKIETYKLIRNIIKQLPEKNKNIIIKYFGFIDNQPISQDKIADEVGLSQAQVSRIIKRY